MAFITWLLKNRFLVLLATVAAVVAGVVAWTRLPIDAFPDVTNTQVMILSKAPGLAAVDVEQRVSYPIEQVMRGLPRVNAGSLDLQGRAVPGGHRLRGRRRHLLDPTGGLRAPGHGAGGSPARRRARARSDQHRPRRDLPVHARGREARRHRAAHAPGLAGGAAAQADRRA